MVGKGPRTVGAMTTLQPIPKPRHQELKTQGGQTSNVGAQIAAKQAEGQRQLP